MHAPARRRVIVTRPQPEATRWCADLGQRGFDAWALPLIDIAPVTDPGPLQAAALSLGGYDAVMFVSRNAVTHFFEQKVPLPSVIWSFSAMKKRAWSPGPGTTAALRDAGLTSTQIDDPAPGGQFDSEALWARVRTQVGSGTRVLVVRGGDAHGVPGGRDWLAAQVVAAGGVVDEVVAYRRVAPVFDAARQQLAREAATDGSLWLFSSSEAVANLQRAMPAQDWHQARALATHPRIAQAATAAGFGRVARCRPTLDDVTLSIKSDA